MRCRRLFGFTLIELMIVVAIMAILSAILVPWFLRARSQALKPEASKSSSPVTEKRALPSGQLPEGVELQLQLELQAQPERVGLDVLNRYTLVHKGQYRFRLSQSPTLIQIPLPRENRGFGQLSILQRTPGSNWESPPDMVFGDGWLAWAQAEGDELEVKVSYHSEGQNLLYLAFPPAAIHNKLSVLMNSESQLHVPAVGLRPQEAGVWERERILSPSPLVLELPPLEDPLTRVIKLFRLTGLAVLLFGAGFWYLGELYRSGSLANFGFGSFSLLAMNYSMFFISFAVLGFHELLQPQRNLALSALLTTPVLLYHVAQILDWKFAISRALPLSVATLGLVYNGVYGGHARDIVYLGYALCVGCLLTLSYRPFVEVNDKRVADRKKRVEEAVSAHYSAREEAREWKERVRENLETSRLRASQQEALKSALEHHQDLTKYTDLPANPDTWLEQVLVDTQKIRDATDTLRRECDFVEQHLPQQPESEGQQLHCLACGRESVGGKYCCHCSVPLPEVLQCPSCGHESVLPRHLPSLGPYHCYRCGHRH